MDKKDQLEFEGIAESRLIETLPKTKKNRQKIAKELEEIDLSTVSLADLAKVGLNALIDEATGSQAARGVNALRKQIKGERDE